MHALGNAWSSDGKTTGRELVVKDLPAATLATPGAHRHLR
jgi:hypothetical protein